MIDALIQVAQASQWFFLFYFIGINSVYIFLNFVAIFYVLHYMKRRRALFLPQSHSRYHQPVSILVPAYNEEGTISPSIYSLLQLDYSKFEIIIINDGSKDRTLEILKEEFDLVEHTKPYRKQVKTQEIKRVYISRKYGNLKVIDKHNGGKADALNAGINLSHYPLFCGVDADSILLRDSLKVATRPFLEDRRTIASGASVRLANGCTARHGFLEKVGLPKNPLALFQLVEYLRAFLFGRLGWSPMNGLLIISGAFGVFRREEVVSIGGYRHDTVGEDMDLVMRLHIKMKEDKRDYRIVFIPDPVCWTEVPEDLKVLRNQRIRWQRGLCESLINNKSLVTSPRSGAAGWLAYPFMLFFEMLGPLIEVAGYIFMITLFIFGLVSTEAFIAFMVAAIGLGILLSVSSLLLEEYSFHVYPKGRMYLLLILVAILENFGYRQLNSWWRLVGLYRWATGTKGSWGDMSRKGVLGSVHGGTQLKT